MNSDAARSSLISRIIALQPYELLLLAALPGFALFMGSILLGIDHVLTPPDAAYSGAAGVRREVGYVPALNWSGTYLLLFPLSLFFMTSAVHGMAHALDELHRRGMVRNGGKTVDDPVVSRSWEEGSPSRSRLLWIFAVVIPFSFSTGEWFRNSLLRLFGGGPAAAYPDYDWGLAGLMFDWSAPWKALNAAFDLLAFCTEGALISTSFAFFVLLLDVHRALSKPAGHSITLLPDLTSGDVRRGFEVFSEPLQHMLLSALVSYLICYLVRLQGIYMNSNGAESLGAFVASQNLDKIVLVAMSDWKNVPAEMLHLVDPGPYAFRGLLAWTVSGLMSACSLIVVIFTVRSAAGRARAAAISLLGKEPSLFGGGADAEKSRAESMEVWPLAYMGLNTLIIVAALAFITLYLFRIGLYFALLTIVVLLLKGTARIVKIAAKAS